MSKINVIDIISFNGEPIVELRIKYLYDYVDLFYIIESQYTHSGKKKDFLYCKSDNFNIIFEPYLPKIELIIINEFPTVNEKWLNTKIYDYMTNGSYESWFREHYQRNYLYENISVELYRNLVISKKPYIALICDADEIPNHEVIQGLRNNYNLLNDEPYYLEMNFYYYNFNWLKKEKWYFAYVINDNFINKNGGDLTYYRTNHKKNMILANGGWHCSYFLSWKDINRKLESFAHRECDKDIIKDVNNYKKYINTGIDLFARGDHENMTYCEHTEGLPGTDIAIEFNDYIKKIQK